MRTKLKTIRENARISQITLCYRSGVSIATISGIERGMIEKPRRETLEKLAKALNCSVLAIDPRGV